MSGYRALLGSRPSVVLTAALWACGPSIGALPLNTSPPAKVAPDQNVTVITSGRRIALHGVVLTADSLIGIPLSDQLACESCRVALPLGQIDSVLVSRHDQVAMITIAAPFVFLATLLLLAPRMD